MRVYCRECGAKALVVKSLRHSVDAIDIYLNCSDVNCGHRFVWSAGYKHSISETNREKSEVIEMLIETLPTGKKRDLLNKLESLGI